MSADCVGTPTVEETAVTNWVEVRQEGKFLLEYDPQNGRVRLRRWGREFVIDLGAIAVSRTSVLKSKT